jgi:hypothetical protein
LQNGDWITGFGISANTRVVSGGGTATVTMSRNATASQNGIKIGFGHLKRIDGEGVAADNGNATAVLHPAQDVAVQPWETTLTAGRFAVLTAGESGDRFLIKRSAGGAQLLTLGTINSDVLGQQQWADIRYKPAAAGYDVYARGNLNDINHPAVSADNGDAAATLQAGANEQTQLWNTPLTADRAVTLATTSTPNGSKFRIVRGSGATGAHNLNVGTGPLKALGSASTWVDVEYNGSAWIETASGSL